MKKLTAVGIAALLLTSSLIYGGLHLADTAYDRGDFAFALRLYKPLAVLGISSYRMRVGFMYMKGQGVPRDYSVAARWYLEPANNGDPRAQYALGILYIFGSRGFDDRERSFAWLLKSASRGFKPAQALVSHSYSTGDGVAEDKVQAYKWAMISLDGELPEILEDNAPISFTNGLAPAQIAEAQRLAREWIAERGEKL